MAVLSGVCKAGAGQELTLEEGLKAVLENSRAIEIYSYNEGISFEDTLVKRAKLFPEVRVFAEQRLFASQPGAIFGAQSVPTAEKSSFSFGVGINQTIYDFGGRGFRYEASKNSLEAVRLDIRRIKNLVALDFINDFFNLLEAEKMVSVGQKEVESLEAHLGVAQSLFEEGVITKNDLLQAEVKLSDARQRLINLGSARQVNAERLNNMLARPLKSEIRPVEPEVDVAFEIDLDAQWEEALRQRVELKAIDHELTAIGLEETAKKSEYYPEFFAQGRFDYTENRYLFHEDNWTFTVGMNMDLSSGGYTRAEVQKLRLRKNQIIEQRKKLMDDIKLEVVEAVLAIRNARERLKTAEGAVGQAEENLRINRVRYEEGAGTATDVLDAIALLSTAETNRYRAGYELRRAQGALAYAMGLDLFSFYEAGRRRT